MTRGQARREIMKAEIKGGNQGTETEIWPFLCEEGMVECRQVENIVLMDGCVCDACET